MAKKKPITHLQYCTLQLEYAMQLFKQGNSVQEVQRSLNVPETINLNFIQELATEKETN